MNYQYDIKKTQSKHPQSALIDTPYDLPNNSASYLILFLEKFQPAEMLLGSEIRMGTE